MKKKGAEGSLIVPDLKDYSPWFHRGVLVYEKSGHTLTYLNGYYMCSERQKYKCSDNSESNLKAIEFEKTFAELMQDLRLDEEVAKKIFYAMDKERIEIFAEDIHREKQLLNNMQIVIDAIEKRLKDEKKISRLDVAEFKNYYYEELKITYTRFLINRIEDYLQYFGRPITDEKKFAGVMETIVEKIYISNGGAIQKIKFEGMIDYLIQYLKSKVPGYLSNSKIVITESNHFESLNLKDVIKQLKKNNFRNTLSYFMFGSKYKEDKQLKQLFKNAEGAEPKEVIKTLYLAKYLSWTLWAHLNLKITSKNNHGRTAEWLKQLHDKQGKNLTVFGINL